jgi:hypothetical protein
MSTIVKQGILNIGSNMLFEAEIKKNYIVKLIKFTNISAYDIELKKYDTSDNTELTVVKLSLDPGDTVLDTTPYTINQKDKLIVNTTTANTSYIIELTEL